MKIKTLKFSFIMLTFLIGIVSLSSISVFAENGEDSQARYGIREVKQVQGSGEIPDTEAIALCPMKCVCSNGVIECPTDEISIVTEVSEGEVSPGIESPKIPFLMSRKNEKISFKIGEIEAETSKDIKLVNSRLYAETSKGNKEIKIMPKTASEKAIERLGELDFIIELKEVGDEKNRQLAYELQAERHVKILGLFKTKAKVKAQVNAENGEVVSIEKPWWSFLASGI